jgi:dTDP-4-amino-4,6-dideoxygalactose transaminase
MYNIPMVDLQNQYKSIESDVDAAVLKSIKSGKYINGPEVASFKENLQQFLGVKHVIPCANGTDALQLALMAAGLEPGDEVIAPSFTFVATAEVIALMGLTPILIDVHPDTFCLDENKLEDLITSKTKAIVPVHLFGQCANMEAIMNIANKHNLLVVEDNAQAIGADYTFTNGETAKAGTIGQIGCTSFFPSKNLGCYGDGGAVFTNDDALAKRIAVIANHGMDVRYYHDEIGINSRLDSVQAAILDIKLKKLNAYNSARQNASDLYEKHLGKEAKLTLPKVANFTNHVYHQYTVLAESLELREAIIKHLQSVGIACAVYYPVPLHKQKAYKSERYPDASFPVTNYLSDHVFSLPMHTELSNEVVEIIANEIKKVL